MQYLIIGKDGTDKDAKKRRMQARPDHIAMGDKLLASGNLWYGAALLDDAGNMIGSMYMVDFPSRKELDEYLKIEPYVVEGVWKSIEILKCNTRDPWQFNRPREFYEKKG